ncbi:MORC family CW-type zinc finger protein 3 isoform X2 [Festucalex cinctus]
MLARTTNMAKLSEQGIRLSSMSPAFLNSNSTSHTWPFSAVAELIDNASDPGVAAKQIWVDVTNEGSELCLTFTDNGSGMTPNKLHKMLSFGFTDKGPGKNQAIGVYGNGFKSGSMRLGRDAIIFTKNGGCQTVGMLSQTYLKTIKAQAVIVPTVPFSQQTKSLVVTEDSEASLAAILKYSIVTSVEQIHAHFDSILSKKGTKIIIWNICRAKDGEPELDFKTDERDIRLPEVSIDELKGCKFPKEKEGLPEMYYSLRAYLSILYLKPRTQVVLRGKKILAKLVSKSLKYIKHDVYKPHASNEKVKVTFGLNIQTKDHYGMMMYYKNRLIKAYEKVGCQQKTVGQRAGVGVIGIIECNFLKPAHNKQDFEYTKDYQLTHGALGLKLNYYWKDMGETMSGEFQSPGVEEVKDSNDTDGPTWLQCEDCLKWRSVPRGQYKVTPESWKCSQNPNPHYSCSSPEEKEDSDEYLRANYVKKQKKEDQLHSRKQETSPAVQTLPLHFSQTCQPTSQIGKSTKHADGNALKDDKKTAARGNKISDNAQRSLGQNVNVMKRNNERETHLERTGGDKASTDTLRHKRKSESSTDGATNKRLCHEKDSDSENGLEHDFHPQPQTTLPSRTVNQDPSINQDPVGSSSDSEKEAPLAATTTHKPARLEAETQTLETRLSAEPRKTSRATMTEWSENDWTATCTPPPARREIACQTNSSSLPNGPAQDPENHETVLQPNEEHDHKQHRKEPNEARVHEEISSMEKALYHIRSNLVALLKLLLPQLDLSGISLESADVDDILQQIVEVNAFQL